MSSLERPDDFEARRAHLRELSDEELHARFWGLVDDLVQRTIRGATAANSLVFRLLMIWAVVIAAMTLYGWTQ